MKNLLVKMSRFILVLVTILSISATAFAHSPSTKEIDANTIYEVTIGDTTIELKEGEKAEIPLTSINNSNSDIQPETTFPGDAGTLDLWPSAGRVYYSITMHIPASSFSGIMTVTDLTSGLSGGRTPVVSFNGSVPTSNLSGHQYSASLSGAAFFGAELVATVVPNYITWIN